MSNIYEINIKYVKTMVTQLNNISQYKKEDIDIAKIIFSMIFDSDMLHQNHNKTDFTLVMEKVLIKFYKINQEEFQEFINMMNEFKSDMISFDSITISDLQVY